MGVENSQSISSGHRSLRRVLMMVDGRDKVNVYYILVLHDFENTELFYMCFILGFIVYLAICVLTMCEKRC